MKTIITNYTLNFMAALAILALAQGLYNATLWAIEGTTSAEKYYKYTSVDPISDAFLIGEKPRFVTDAEYYKNIDVRWEDTLFCVESGFINKYATQYWPEEGFERKDAGFKTLDVIPGIAELPSWTYFIEPISENATSCRLKWRVIGETPRGWEKSYSGYTNWFLVNQ